MISVVISTYNGENYIKQQLESILNQTLKVDEVIIKDDKSSDDTVIICNRFIEENSLDGWRVIVNSTNLGFKTNFISALKIAKGDIVFLCDQDDVWIENRVAIMKKIMKENQNIQSLATTVSVFDDDGSIISEHWKHPNANKNGLKHISRKKFYEFSDYLGMTMVVRKCLIDKVRVKPVETLSHDILINYYAVCMDGMYYYDKVLTRRRASGQSVSGVTEKKELFEKFHGNQRLHQISIRKNKMNEFKAVNSELGIATDKKMKKIMENMDTRQRYIEENKWLPYMAGIFKLFSYESFREYLKDGKALLQRGKRNK